MKYNFKGGDRVEFVSMQNGLSGRGTVVVCVSDLPVIGQGYVVKCDDPVAMGIDQNEYPFDSIVVYQRKLAD
jgi:hypothetical protein